MIREPRGSGWEARVHVKDLNESRASRVSTLVLTATNPEKTEAEARALPK